MHAPLRKGLLSLLFFIAFSLVLNWFGKATKYSPFRK